MPRISLNAADRQDQILDVAQRLFMARGYDATPVQAIIDEVGIAKGTFYHHYPSKPALLEALIDRIVEQSIAVVRPIATDATLAAPAKFTALFERAGAWKAARRELLIAMHKAMNTEANAPLQARLQRASLDAITPLLAGIIRQGVAEGAFDTAHPVTAARMVLELGTTLSRTLGDALTRGGAELEPLMREVEAYNDAVRRLLGAAPGAVRVMDPALVTVWFEDP